MSPNSSPKASPGSAGNAAEQVLRDKVKAVLSSLTKPEREVLQLRFGLLDGRPRHHSEIGAALGLSEEDVLSIEAGALRKLSHPDLDKIHRLTL